MMLVKLLVKLGTLLIMISRSMRLPITNYQHTPKIKDSTDLRKKVKVKVSVSVLEGIHEKRNFFGIGINFGWLNCSKIKKYNSVCWCCLALTLTCQNIFLNGKRPSSQQFLCYRVSKFFILQQALPVLDHSIIWNGCIIQRCWQLAIVGVIHEFCFEKGHLIASNGAFNSCFHFLVVVTLHLMKSKGNWVENLNSQVCVNQIERSVQDRKVKKNGSNKKTPKINNIISFFVCYKINPL